MLGEWLLARHGAAAKRTTAGYIMSSCLHVPAYVGALLLHHEGRLPSLRPDELAFRLCDDRPRPEGVAVLGDGFYCLPSDPGSGRPEATVVPDERALAAVLRAHYIAHAARLRERVRAGQQAGHARALGGRDGRARQFFLVGGQAGWHEGLRGRRSPTRRWCSNPVSIR